MVTIHEVARTRIRTAFPDDEGVDFVTPITRSTFPWVYFTLAAIFFNSGLSRAEEPRDAKTDPDPAALALFDEVVKAYRAIPAYVDRGEFVSTIRVNGKVKTERSPVRIAFVRPNKIDVEAGVARLISDGKTMTTVSSPLKTYEIQAAPESLSPSPFPLKEAAFDPSTL